ncbi:hypothetical protein LCGC14_0674700 [marine sediment metagenome]|uniref:Uncharacterized protein n=1 Tax=marine sediment metagenome TaxID=412755 RepID=A0A0F9TXZ4_9ZZZZ
MPIRIDRQVIITCDDCGENLIYPEETQERAKKQARKDGWIVGKKNVLCFECLDVRQG